MSLSGLLYVLFLPNICLCIIVYVCTYQQYIIHSLKIEKKEKKKDEGKYFYGHSSKQKFNISLSVLGTYS